MADIQKLYEQWLAKATADPDLKAELESIKNDEDGKNDRFYRDLEFGTGGLRGVIGAGTNRMNVYTVKKATQGLAEYILASGEKKSVAISCDSRIKSDYFSKSAAEVLAANGIKVHIYKELMPTPMLSWAVRALDCGAGVMVTASHNPAKYNGYKVYGNDGCQLTLEAAEAVLAKINAIDIFDGVKSTDFDKAVADGMISFIGDDVIDAYMAKVKEQGLHTDLVASSGLKVVYTPLNGTGNKPVRRILREIGVKDVVVVPEQEKPDAHAPIDPLVPKNGLQIFIRLHSIRLFHLASRYFALYEATPTPIHTAYLSSVRITVSGMSGSPSPSRSPVGSSKPVQALIQI